jgi:hypothetical protein
MYSTYDLAVTRFDPFGFVKQLAEMHHKLFLSKLIHNLNCRKIAQNAGSSKKMYVQNVKFFFISRFIFSRLIFQSFNLFSHELVAFPLVNVGSGDHAADDVSTVVVVVAPGVAVVVPEENTLLVFSKISGFSEKLGLLSTIG